MKMCSEVFQFEKELKWENPGPGIRRQIMGYDEQLMMVKVQFEKGGCRYNARTSSQSGYLCGKWKVRINDWRTERNTIGRRWLLCGS